MCKNVFAFFSRFCMFSIIFIGKTFSIQWFVCLRFRTWNEVWWVLSLLFRISSLQTLWKLLKMMIWFYWITNFIPWEWLFMDSRFILINENFYSQSQNISWKRIPKVLATSYQHRQGYTTTGYLSHVLEETQEMSLSEIVGISMPASRFRVGILIILMRCWR